jgi:hypothetical protein
MHQTGYPSGHGMSETTAAVLRSLVADGVIIGFALAETSGGSPVLTVFSPRGSDPTETEASVKAAIREDWSVSAQPAGGA